MSTLRNLWEGTNSQQAKHASGGVGSEWENAAQMFGFANGEDLMDKVATAHVVNQVAMTKYANGQILMGEAMAAGYWDTMTKIASANAVRDGIPQEYIDIAKASRQALADHFVKVAAAGNPGMFQQLVDKLSSGAGYIKEGAGKAMTAVGDNFKQGYESAKQVLGKGKYGNPGQGAAGGLADNATEAAFFGNRASARTGDAAEMLAQGRKNVQSAGGVGTFSPKAGRGANETAVGDEVARIAESLGVPIEDAALALRSRPQALADAAVRLGIPAAALTGGTAYAVS